MFCRVRKKLKVKWLLKLHSASKGTIRIRSHLQKFNDLQPGKICTQFLKTFPYDTMLLLFAITSSVVKSVKIPVVKSVKVPVVEVAEHTNRSHLIPP